MSSSGTGAGIDTDAGTETDAHSPNDDIDLPSITSFRDNPTDQFLTDFSAMSGGHPFKGQRSSTPHSGAHIHFDTAPSTTHDPNVPATYPAIYAVADGVVSHVDTSLDVGTNDRYGITLRIARDGETDWELEYSIEPMIPEPAPDFYRAFLAVNEGDRVHKGDVIAHMYIPTGANGTHIHFHLMAGRGGQFVAPAIFTNEVMAQFRDRWGEFGRDGANGDIPQCMGWMLSEAENLFGDGAVDCL